MKKLILNFVFIFISCFGFSQSIEFSKTNFPTDKEGLKTALKNIQEGDGYYYGSIKSKALESYLKAQEFNAKNAELNAKIGDCYFKIGEITNAEKKLETAINLDKNIDGYYYFLLAKAYHANNNFSKASTQYKLAKTKGSKINPIAIETCDKKIKECIYAEKLVASPVNVKITNVGKSINSANQEYVPVITADESEMFFTSRRENTVGGERDLGIDDFYEDIYYSVKEKDTWSEAKNIGAPINSISHDATVGLSIDGQKLFIYRDNKNGDGNILVTERKGNDWTEPVELPKPINSKYQETSACYDYTGKTIYFVSDRPKGLGGKDIYKATQATDGSWGEAENLGTTINTAFDEDAIFLHPDGKTLYFSSNGENTMGGFDIFKSVYEKGKWSKPINLGFPINSANDDVCFVLTANGENGYYTSEQIGGEGKKDIYRITFLDEIKNNNRPRLTLLKGIVFDSKTKAPLSALIEIYDNDADKLVATYESNSASGKYIVSLPAGHNYGISVKKTGYLFHSENVNIPDTAAFQEIERNIGLNKLEAGKKIVLANIFYDYNKASLRNSSFNELDKVVELLTKNPKMKVELGAHSDSRGGDAYNLKLSQERAQSCVDYLTSKGIDKSRLNAKGYGEANPIIPDSEINKLTTEKAKEDAFQQNRRTEFKILEN